MRNPFLIKKIESTSDALRFLYSLTYDTSTFRFRGQVNAEWKLIPSIYRYCNFERYQTVQHESLLLQEKPKIPIQPLTHTDFDLEWMMVCQHYDIPTRLLDWTTDILIALFFTCYDKEGKDNDKNGALYICKVDDYPTFGAYESHIMKSQELSFISTSIVNPRMRMQSGNFMLWGHVPLTEDTTETYDLWEYHKIKKKTIKPKRIIIPNYRKETILRELKEVYGISSSSLYLENGYLEKKYNRHFPELKENLRLKTLYTTDAERLNPEEELKAKLLFRIDCRNMIKGCVRLNQIM